VSNTVVPQDEKCGNLEV